MSKYIYFFGNNKADGRAEMKDLLGGKGAGLAAMASMGLPVPPGFTITTEASQLLGGDDQDEIKKIQAEISASLTHLEQTNDKKLGDASDPLLVSVRSGASISMPGMMDTVLNLGLNDAAVDGLAHKTHNERFAYDSYRRFIQMFGEIVLGLEHSGADERSPFELLIESLKKERGLGEDRELLVPDLHRLVQLFKQEIMQLSGKEFLQDPLEQLFATIDAVCNSWDNPRAKAYRKMNQIPENLGTAINVQTMVFGNMGDKSGTGVLFTRDPATGEKVLFGEYLLNAQGEDVVAGIRTPQPIARLQTVMPEAHRQLEKICSTLEHYFKDMQDIEFTIQEGNVWMLQTRRAKRTGLAALRIAAEMQAEGLIDKREALLRIEPEQLNHLLRPGFAQTEKNQAIQNGKVLACGLPAGPGAASGKVVFSALEAEREARRGEKVILVRIETSPEDIKGMNAAEGILTARGGMTSHAALVSRQMGKVCIVGCDTVQIDYAQKYMRVDDTIVRHGDYISLDGSTGEVIAGELTTNLSDVLQVVLRQDEAKKKSKAYSLYALIMEWVDEVRDMQVRANADQPDQATTAIALGAEGIGLCRTEHMFFGENKIDFMREMILADDLASREHALAKLLPIQREDFKGIFRVMNGRPVTIRTLDPPLHEFLPQTDAEIVRLAKQMSISEQKIHERIESLKEANPMLGHRGCRLGIVYSEITRMQARAVLEAACEIQQEGIAVKPEIMIPLVGFETELLAQKKVVEIEAQKVMVEKEQTIDYKIGTMIELPRAALIADKLVGPAEFFSFGTNDLTQTTLGISRDDSGKFLEEYIEMDIFPADPFQTLDQEGVGILVKEAVQRARQKDAQFKIGVCGEHGGDPRSIEFFYRIGLDYVSCSPYRLPIARLAAAQQVLKE